MPNIRKLETDDIPVIAKLHIDHMPLTFPPCKSYFNLMKLIYSSFLVNKEGISYVAIIDNTIVGYVCLHKCSKKIYTTTFKNYPVAFSCHVLMLLLQFPDFFIKGLDRVHRILRSSRLKNLSKTSDSNSWGEDYEIRPMVVRKDKQGTPVAKNLISRVEKTLVNRGEIKYFLRVRKDNARAIAFYNKMGFTKLKNENIRIIMTKNLKLMSC